MEKKPDMVKDMMERLENGVKAIQNSEEYKAYLQTMSKFTNYSFYKFDVNPHAKPGRYAGSGLPLLGKEL